MQMTDAITQQELSVYSDLYKDVYGCRPRNVYFASYEAYLESYHFLVKEFDIVIEQEKKVEQRNIVIFEQMVDNTMALVGCDRARAIVIIAQSENISAEELEVYKYGSLEYSYGLPFGYISPSLANAA